MPVLASSYNLPFILKSGFISTVYSGLFRKVTGVIQKRERLILSDTDFLDLDWSYAAQGSNRLVIILHGLEGNAQRPYMLGAAKSFVDHGIDAVCMNFRGCSGEANLKFKSYHSGETKDLSEVIDHIVATGVYDEIYINGFSLGGNVALKYLGEGNHIPKQIKGSVVVSVPCFLKGSSKELHSIKNKPYAIRFLRHLIHRLKQKQKVFPDLISKQEIKSIKTLKDFDEVYTAKAHGFADASDYYTKSSSLQNLKHIKLPTLIINATNDSFLSSECYPIKAAESNNYLHLEMPKFGGHVGFYDSTNLYYNEKRALEFINEKK